MCQFCTYVNTNPTVVCEMCNLSCKDSAGVSLPQSLQQTPSSSIKDQPQLGVRPQPKPRVNLELKRQKMMREDGLSLIHQIRVSQHGYFSQTNTPAPSHETNNVTNPTTGKLKLGNVMYFCYREQHSPQY